MLNLIGTGVYYLISWLAYRLMFSNIPYLPVRYTQRGGTLGFRFVCLHIILASLASLVLDAGFIFTTVLVGGAITTALVVMAEGQINIRHLKMRVLRIAGQKEPITKVMVLLASYYWIPAIITSIVVAGVFCCQGNKTTVSLLVIAWIVSTASRYLAERGVHQNSSWKSWILKHPHAVRFRVYLLVYAIYIVTIVSFTGTILQTISILVLPVISEIVSRKAMKFTRRLKY